MYYQITDIFHVHRLGDRHSRRPGKYNGDVLEPDVCARVLEHQSGRAGREIRRHVQANRRKVRSSDPDITNRARKDSNFYLALHKQHPNRNTNLAFYRLPDPFDK